MNIFQRVIKAFNDVQWYPVGSNSSSFVNGSGWLRSRVSKKALLDEYKNLVYSCVSLIAEGVAKYEPYVYKQTVNGIPEPLKNHPLIDLIRNPADEMSMYNLFEATQTYLELTGEAYWYMVLGEITRRPKEIGGVLRPDKVFEVIDKGKLLGYVYREDNGKEIPFELDEIVAFRKFNPFNQRKGYGPVEAGKLYVDIENETSLFQWGVLKNQASPAGIVGLNGNIKAEAFEKLKKQWKEEYGGTSNAGKTLFIRNTEASFTKVGLSLNDLSIPDLSKVNDEKIRKMFKISREMLGDTSNSGLGRANIEAIEYTHAKWVIEPREIRLDDVLSTLLVRYWGELDTRVGHVSRIPKDDARLLEEYNQGVDRWITRNEIRRQKGLGNVEGGDVLYVPFSNIPIESQQSAVTPQTEVTNALHKDGCGHDHSKEKGGKVVEKGRENFFRVLDQLELNEGRRYSRGLNRLLVVQEKEVLEKVKRYFSKGVKKNVNFDGTLFELSFSDEDIQLNLLTWLLSAFVKSGEYTFESLGKPDQEFILRQAQRDSLFNSTERLMRSFNEETTQKLQQQIAQGLEFGEDIEKISKRIESVYDDAKGYRSMRIADTEVHKAVNQGTAEVYKEEGYTKLVWQANSGACEYCVGMDGQEVEMDQPFVRVGESVSGENGSEYVNDYVDVKYADLHPNCKCRLVPSK